MFVTNLMRFLKAECELHNLPPIELYKFSGNPSKWPEFIENFSKHVYLKTTFSHNQRMERLLNVFRQGSKKDGSVYCTKWHILSNSIEMSKTRLWKPNSCFIFKTKGIIQSVTVASKK